MSVEVNSEKKILTVQQELIFYNQSGDTIKKLVLNDWNNAYSSKKTPLAKRFSDEFIRNFHLAKESERGSTNNITIIDQNKLFLTWSRTTENPDLIEVDLRNDVLPNQKIILQLTYLIKLPSDKFTKFGYGENNKMYLKNWVLTPARYQEGQFIKYNNNNLDDIANGSSNFDIEIKIPEKLNLQSDLDQVTYNILNGFKVYELSGNNRTDFNLFINPDNEFHSYKNDVVEVVTDLKDNNLTDVQKAILIDKIVRFVNENIGQFPHKKITVAQADYERNPFYGLNQLPSFISPFANDFLYEIKFLKTYLNNFLKSSLTTNAREDNWIYDGIQVNTMMKYISEFHPESKMMGSISKLGILKSYNIVNLDFNEQYSYFYMLMARKNLDQPLGDSKNKLIKFNEQIASKYRAGLSFNYLDTYLEKNIVKKSIKEFYTLNQDKQTSRTDLKIILNKNANKNIDWFFNTIIDSRAIVDYKFETVTKTKDSIIFTIKNKTGTTVPIPVYGFKNKKVIFKKWYENISTDSTFTIPRTDINKIVINYNNEVPEYNLRNNWKSLKGFSPSNRPFKFVFMKDLEDPYYNQILYVPSITYNLYDGLSPGLRFHNKTILDKPFLFDINPAYSSNTKSLIGAFSFLVNQNNRDSRLFNIKYSLGGSYFHYAQNATYSKINPAVYLRFRPVDLRDNRKQLLILREVLVDREKSNLSINSTNENYNVFNVKYINTKTEVTEHFNFLSDFQISNKFGKLASEIEYRKLFQDNRQVNLRLYAGTFIFNNTNSDFFSFALDRPTDYLFDYNYYGRSENSGIFSQQLILSEGGFKSKLATPFANQWIATLNGSFNIWNWIEVYGDLGFVKNKLQPEKFVYDSGIRFNLVTDYFELYFPVYSNNGWEISQKNYNEKIRFIVTLDPRILVNLFTRKWF